MAKRHSTPLARRPIPSRKPIKPRSFVQRIAWNVIEIDECLRDLANYMEKLEQATRASRRLGAQIYRQIREEEIRRKSMKRNKPY